MAQKKKKKSAPKKRNSKSANISLIKNKQFTAIILFAIGVLSFCIALIDAEGLWGALRTFAFGIFGFNAFIFPLFLLVFSALIAIDKTNKKIITKIIEVILLLTMISIILHIIEFSSAQTYMDSIKDAYNSYKIDDKMLGGGVWGAIIGGLLLVVTGGSRPAALVIAFLFLFIILLILSNITLGNIIRSFSKPAKKIGEYTSDKISEYGEKIEQRNLEREQRKKEFNPDVDLGPEPIQLNNYNEIDVDELPSFASVIEQKNSVEEVKKEPIDNVINLNDIIKKNTKTNSKKVETIEELEVKEADEVVNDEDKVDSHDVKPYILPSLDCLNLPKNDNSVGFENELKQNANKLVETLKSFGVETRIVDIARGPSVTRYEIQPAAGVKISKITNLSDDIALNLAASGVRIEAPIPNKAAVGIEIPNKNRQSVTLREVIDTSAYKNAKSKLTVALGKDITGEFVYSDLVKMPHLLIAGTTGSGKSVCLNSMIVSILYNATPDEVKLLMIDPKQVEFTIYNGIPHLLVPVVSDPRKASGALGWAVTEMLTRYKTFSENAVRDISGYNSICESQGKKKMPQIVIFIDELSDLMMAAPNEVEDSICRLAQMARAAGMHLVIATQRPSVDVITGIIKANIPSRISLSVSSQVDSRTIIDSVGAEKLLGNGDMLYYPVGIPKPIRVQGCYLSDKEVENVVNFIKNQEQSVYDDDVMKEIDRHAANSGSKKKDNTASNEEDSGPADEMLPKAIEAVVEAQSASTTLLQRKLKLGYARAARIIDELESRGIIGPYEGAKPRKVLISKQQWFEMNALAQSGADKPYGENEEVNSEE